MTAKELAEQSTTRSRALRRSARLVIAQLAMSTSPLPSCRLWNREEAHDTRDALFGGTGVVRVWSLVKAPAAPFTAVLACELEPSASVGAHLQEHFPELVIAVSGRGRVSVGGATSAFDEGSVVELARGQTLALSNLSNDEPLRYLIIKAQHR